MVGAVAEKTVIPPRSAKWVSDVAPNGVEYKVVAVMPKDKFKDNPELLMVNSDDEVTDGVVPAWVVNTTAQEQQIDLFEGLAEDAECDILDVVEEGEESFQNSGFTMPTPTIDPPPAIIRDMQPEEGQLCLTS